jgi:pimeloyl-ACP methyl ester carboxylesterase
MENLIVEGTGRPILVLHGGMGDLSSWEEVTNRLRDRFRAARLHRRQYRLDVPRKVTMADEVTEVLAAAETLSRPVLVGHSSGAVLALETLAAAPPGLFAGAVLYEPPLMIDDDHPLGSGTQPDIAAVRDGRPADRARTALADGRPGTAFAIFLREIAGMRDPMVDAAEAAMNSRPEIAPVVERQLDDNDAIDALGSRLTTYAKIDLPVLLITGDQSPRHLLERSAALQAVLPDARRVTLAGESHNAERSAPDRLADAIGRFTENETKEDV